MTHDAGVGKSSDDRLCSRVLVNGDYAVGRIVFDGRGDRFPDPQRAACNKDQKKEQQRRQSSSRSSLRETHIDPA